MAVYRSLVSSLVCLVMAGCGTFSSKGETELGFGIRAFEDGEHAYAARLLQLRLQPDSAVPRRIQNGAGGRSLIRPPGRRGRTPDLGSRIPQREAEEIARP